MTFVTFRSVLVAESKGLLQGPGNIIDFTGWCSACFSFLTTTSCVVLNQVETAGSSSSAVRLPSRLCWDWGEWRNSCCS